MDDCSGNSGAYGSAGPGDDDVAVSSARFDPEEISARHPPPIAANKLPKVRVILALVSRTISCRDIKFEHCRVPKENTWHTSLNMALPDCRQIADHLVRFHNLASIDALARLNACV